MRDFYEITTVSFFDEKFAYNETTDPANYSKPQCPRCPKCGRYLGKLYWLEPRRVILSKPKYGDFVLGNNFLVSEKFKEAYEKTDLKGIKKFLPVEVAKVRYMREKSPLPPQYYILELEYSFARIDKEKSIIKWDMAGAEPNQACSLCFPYGAIPKKIKGIYIDDSEWGGEDIFHLHETGGVVYASQKFVDFCLEKEFTNFKYVNTKDYVYS